MSFSQEKKEMEAGHDSICSQFKFIAVRRKQLGKEISVVAVKLPSGHFAVMKRSLVCCALWVNTAGKHFLTEMKEHSEISWRNSSSLLN